MGISWIEALKGTLAQALPKVFDSDYKKGQYEGDQIEAINHR